MADDWILREKVEDDARLAEAGDRLASAGHRLDCEVMESLDQHDCDCGLHE